MSSNSELSNRVARKSIIRTCCGGSQREGGGEGKKGGTKRQERGRKPGGKEVNVIIKNKFNVLKSKEALYILGFWSPQERSTMYSGIWVKSRGGRQKEENPLAAEGG